MTSLTTALADRLPGEIKTTANRQHPHIPRRFSGSGCREAPNRQQYDVAPDGQDFVMIREFATDAPGNVTCVESWFPELEAQVNAKR